MPPDLMALQCHPLMVTWEHCVKWPLGSHSANSRLLYVIGKRLRSLQGLSLPIQLVSKAEIWLTVFFWHSDFIFKTAQELTVAQRGNFCRMLRYSIL